MVSLNFNVFVKGIRNETARLLQDESERSAADVVRSVSSVKIIYFGFELPPDMFDLSHRNILDCLNHPNVVMLHDKIIDKEEQKIYIVMEVCLAPMIVSQLMID